MEYSLCSYTCTHSQWDQHPLTSITYQRFHLQQCFPVILRTKFGPFISVHQLFSFLNKQTIKPFLSLLLTQFHWVIIFGSKSYNGCFISSPVAIHQKIWHRIKNLGEGEQEGKREKNYSLYVKDFKWILYEYELIWITNNYQRDINSNTLK